MSSGSLNTFNGRNQPVTIIGPDGSTEVVVPLSSFNYFHTAATSLSILYGTQLGACLIMLAVVLGMTPHKRLRRLSTVISILSLLLNSVRTLLFSLYFTSSWSDFYVIFTGDRSTVKQVDRNMSITATCLSIPMTVLIEAALIVQASLMIQLWQTFWKVAAMMLSVALVLTTIGFNLVQTVFQVRAALVVMDLVPYTWIRKTYVGLFTSSICWFCFLFNVRLIMHMWTNRSILPSMKGLKAMDVLVITNGVLMFIPVVFSGLEWGEWAKFEAASLTQTSVILVLPLGILIAQRLANPHWFGTEAASHPSTGLSGLGGSAGPSLGTNPSSTVHTPPAQTSTSSRRHLINRHGRKELTPTAGSDVLMYHQGFGTARGVITQIEKGPMAGYGHGHGNWNVEEEDRILPATDLGGVRVDYKIEIFSREASGPSPVAAATAAMPQRKREDT